MSESYLDGLLDELVPAEPRDGWDDVRRRARRSQRRYVMLVAAVAVFVLAPATWAAVKAFEGSPLPAPVLRTWSEINREWAKGVIAKHFPLAEVGKAHGVLQVKTRDGLYDLWVAPSTTGGVCYLGALERAGRPGSPRAVTLACQGRHAQPSFWQGIASTHGGFEDGSATRGVIYGYVRASATTVQLTFKGGRQKTLPVVEHFFLTPTLFPEGYFVRAMTARDADGRIVARWHFQS